MGFVVIPGDCLRLNTVNSTSRAASNHVSVHVSTARRCRAPQRRASAVVRMAQGGGSPPPVNLPSGALLGISSICAIASVGCIFELSSGNPQYGTAITTGILVLCAPAFAFFYYAAIRKGQAEADE